MSGDFDLIWTGGRVAEGARLESVFRSNLNAGSNPALSARLRYNCVLFQGVSNARQNPTYKLTYK